MLAVKTAHWKPDHPVVDDLVSLVPRLSDGVVVAVASKMFSVLAGCRLPKDGVVWSQLLQEESDGLCSSLSENDDYCLTLKMGRLIVNAGIDHSNGGGDYLLLPRNLQQLTELFWQRLRERDRVRELGLVVTDSGILPLRRGVMGIALAWCGIEAVYDYTDRIDLDGNLMEVTAINVVDSLATAATLVMGEGAESTPIALITEMGEHVKFVDHVPSLRDLKAAQMDMERDLYSKVLSYDKMGWG